MALAVTGTNPTVTRRTLIFLLCAGIFVGGCHKETKTLPVAKTPSATTTAPPPAPSEPMYEISMQAAGDRVPVIMYHDVIEKRDRNAVWFDCTTDEFKVQMETIKSQGFTPISLDDLHKHLTAGTPIPEKSIVITFDDNYQGYYDRAYPILKSYGFPSAMFVHTGFVGNKEGLHPKMDWDTLKLLVQDPLVTIGCHTITHPKLADLDYATQEKELTESKSTLETQLGKKIDYLAYPEGSNNHTTQEISKTAGYTMAFSIVNGPAEESPSILCVNRYVHTRLDKALEDRENALKGGAQGIVHIPLKAAPVAYKEQDVAGVTLALVSGGTPETMTSTTREGVLDFIHRNPGSVAGINGTFFNMAAIKSTDNKLVGPCKTPASAVIQADLETYRYPKLHNRPLVVWGATDFAVLPFNPDRMNDQGTFDSFMPDCTNVFLGGAWLVHAGVARTKEEMNLFASKDINDPRRRAAFGVMKDGTTFAAASKNSVGSDKFAEALATVGAQEAILLDSGFSTSLVYNEKILASGHSTPDQPSRPVPHAIVFKGDLDPESVKIAAAAEPATRPDATEKATPRRRKRHHKRARPPEITVSPASP